MKITPKKILPDNYKPTAEDYERAKEAITEMYQTKLAEKDAEIAKLKNEARTLSLLLHKVATKQLTVVASFCHSDS